MEDGETAKIYDCENCELTEDLSLTSVLNQDLAKEALPYGFVGLLEDLEHVVVPTSTFAPTNARFLPHFPPPPRTTTRKTPSQLGARGVLGGSVRRNL